MAFENKTVEEVNNLIITGLESELNTTFRLLPKSFVKVLAKVLAGTYMTLYKQQAWIFLQLFVDSATFDEVNVLGHKIRPLVKWGELVGIGDPEDATQWEGTVTVTVTSVNTYLMQGTQFKNSATGKIYITTESRLLANASETIPIKCAEAGTAGNLSVDDELQAVNALSNIDRKAVCAAVTTVATDSETAESYRARVRNRWRVQPQGGSLSDYRKWASEVGNVLQTYIYKDDDTASGVIIYVSADTDSRIPSAGLLLEVGEACTYDPDTGEARKPIGAVIDPANDGTYTNIKAVTVTDFDVKITGYSEDEMTSFTASCKSNIGAYFNEREPYVRGLTIDNARTDRISEVNVSAIVDSIAEGVNGYFTDVKIYKDDEEVSSYTLGRGELAKLNDLYINGVKV